MPITAHVLALCADDFGLSASISDASIALVQQQRLSSVSCITNANNFAAAATALRPYLAQVEVGLHFNLTEGAPLTAALTKIWPKLPSVGKLIIATHFGAIPRAQVEAELQAQWQVFYDAFGKEPDFIDGHQHIHAMPVIRDFILAKARSQHKPPWLRNTGCIAGPGYGFKRRVIEYTGGISLQRQLQKHNLHSNTVLLGVYDFSAVNYRHLMQSWLAQLPTKGGLIFCHPGLATTQSDTSGMAQCRASEYRYLASDAFRHDLQAANVQLQPLIRQ